jgi:hypothetical protein
LLPASGNTVRGWTLNEFLLRREHIAEQLIGKAKSLIHLSFDVWTTRSQASYIDIVGHFLGSDLTVKTVLLGIRRLHGTHDGQNIGQAVVSLVDQDYKFRNNLGYFVLDNAKNNDTAVAHILSSIRPDLAPLERRLRCIGHIVNLVAKAFLFGADAKHYEADEFGIQDEESQIKSIELWRKLGPVGKLHNLIMYIRSSSKRMDAFNDVANYMEDVPADSVSKLRIIDDQPTRWNSTYLMIKRANKLHYRLDQFCIEYESDLDSQDMLTAQDWQELNLMEKHLEPLYALVMRTQGNAKHGSYGALWEILVAFEIILINLEDARVKYVLLNKSKGKSKTGSDYMHLSACINAAWGKANKYYKLLDDSPVYVAAVLLHPSLKWSFFHKHWAKKVEWIRRYEKTLQKIWKQQYQDKSPSSSRPSSQQQSSDIIQKLMDLAMDDRAKEDEYHVYCQAPPIRLDEDALVKWWTSMEESFPNLAKWAYDMISIPAMSSECERIFSSAGELLEPRRNRLLDDIVQANECLRQWKLQGIF